MAPFVAVMMVALRIADTAGTAPCAERGDVTSGPAPNRTPTVTPSARQPVSQRPITSNLQGMQTPGRAKGNSIVRRKRALRTVLLGFRGVPTILPSAPPRFAGSRVRG